MTMAPPFRKLFHLGYVVLDLDQAMARMQARFGIAEWKVVPLPPGAPASAIGFGYAGDTLFELVCVDLRQPLMTIHQGFLPGAEDEARLNHVAFLVDGEDELRALIRKNEALGLKTAWLDTFGDIFSHYYYVDTVAELGHFTEFVCLGPEGRDFLASIPRN